MLKNHNVILTGANKGIGNSILQLFVKNHANVWCLVRTCNDVFEAQIKELSEKYSVWIRTVTVELEKEEEVRRAFSDICQEGQTIDILINNAGMNHIGAFMMTPLQEMERLFRVNYFAPIQLIQLVAKKMIRQKKGNIINIGSASGYEHNSGSFSYAATKAALMWATQTISRELAPYQIRVNGVAPGITHTGFIGEDEEWIEREIMARMNMQRKAEPMEIAKAVFYLATEESSFISGQILRVDGGRF